MRTRLLTADDMTAIVTAVGRDAFMDLMIDRLRARLSDFDADVVDVRARDGFHYDKPDLGLLEWMPTMDTGGPVVVKMVGYHPHNPVQRALPSVIATSSMWDSESGHLVAIADATLLTAVRTGAASALATDVLSPERPAVVGVVGLGAQAVTQAHAISRVRPIEAIVGVDTNEQVARTFADRIGFLDVDVRVLDPDDAVDLSAAVDILCTCTSVDIGAGPVVADAGVRPWLHVNAVGADFAGKVELPASLVGRALVVPDSREQCVVEGECQQVPEARIGPSLHELVGNVESARASRHRLTVFDSTGWAVEDDVALRLAIDLADRHGLGTEVQLENLPSDPYDPYAATIGGTGA